VRKLLGVVVLTWLTLLHFFTFTTRVYLSQPDTKIMDIVSDIQFNVAVQSFSTTHLFTAIIIVSIHEAVIAFQLSSAQREE
jgi:hypothetical protein